MKVNHAESDFEKVERCPMCGDAVLERYVCKVQDWSFQSDKADWSFDRCSSCNSIFLNPRPTMDRIPLYYQNYYTHSAPERPMGIAKSLMTLIKSRLKASNSATSLLLKGLGLIPRSIIDDVPLIGNVDVLDVGCGNGVMLDNLPRSWSKTGIEIDPAAAAVAEVKGINVIRGSFEVLKNHGKQYDLILCSHVIEHIYNPTSLLRLCIDALKPNGFLWLQWPNPEADGLRRFGRYWRGLEAPRHICLPSKNSVIKCLTEHLEATVKISDIGRAYRGASVYMNAASRSIKDYKREHLSTGQHIREIFAYLAYRSDIKEDDFCTLLVKKETLDALRREMS